MDVLSAVVDDLLYALMGLDGQYARARLVERDGGGGRRLTYVLEGHIDPSLHDLASRILPMWCVCVGRGRRTRHPVLSSPGFLSRQPLMLWLPFLLEQTCLCWRSRVHHMKVLCGRPPFCAFAMPIAMQRRPCV